MTAAGREFLLITIRSTARRASWHVWRHRLEYAAYVLGALLPLLALIIWALASS
jgi:hypothetical protein